MTEFAPVALTLVFVLNALSAATAIAALSRLGPAAKGQREGVFPLSKGCGSEPSWSTSRPVMALALAQVFELRHHGRTCKGDHHPRGHDHG